MITFFFDGIYIPNYFSLRYVHIYNCFLFIKSYIYLLTICHIIYTTTYTHSHKFSESYKKRVRFVYNICLRHLPYTICIYIHISSWEEKETNNPFLFWKRAPAVIVADVAVNKTQTLADADNNAYTSIKITFLQFRKWSTVLVKIFRFWAVARL